MKQIQMNNPTGNGHGNIYLTLLTVLLYFTTRFTITEWAGIATILAAMSTVGLNVYKFWKEKNNKS